MDHKGELHCPKHNAFCKRKEHKDLAERFRNKIPKLTILTSSCFGNFLFARGQFPFLRSAVTSHHVLRTKTLISLITLGDVCRRGGEIAEPLLHVRADWLRWVCDTCDWQTSLKEFCQLRTQAIQVLPRLTSLSISPLHSYMKEKEKLTSKLALCLSDKNPGQTCPASSRKPKLGFFNLLSSNLNISF